MGAGTGLCRTWGFVGIDSEFRGLKECVKYMQCVLDVFSLSSVVSIVLSACAGLQ